MTTQEPWTITDVTWESKKLISVPEDYSGIMEEKEYAVEILYLFLQD